MITDIIEYRQNHLTLTLQAIGTHFNTYFADGVLDDNDKSPIKQAYALIKAQSDFLGQNWTTGTTDV